MDAKRIKRIVVMELGLPRSATAPAKRSDRRSSSEDDRFAYCAGDRTPGAGYQSARRRGIHYVVIQIVLFIIARSGTRRKQGRESPVLYGNCKAAKLTRSLDFSGQETDLF
jgi:hypothetical protein